MKETSLVMRNQEKVRAMAYCSIFTALIAIGAFIQIPLPNSDYFTLQFLFVIMSGMLLGSKKGGLSVVIYLLIGLVGFPIFAAGGGIGYVLRPTFGYLIGFALASFATGFIVEKIGEDKFLKLLFAGLVGFLIIYLIGFSYKYMILNYLTRVKMPIMAIFLGAFPIDIPGDLVATFIASAACLKLKKSIKL